MIRTLFPTRALPPINVSPSWVLFLAAQVLWGGLFVMRAPADEDWHLNVAVHSSSVTRTTLIYTEPARSAFRARARLDFQRLDEVNVPPAAMALPVRITWTLEEFHTGVAVPVDAGDHDFTVNLPTHGGGAPAQPAKAVLDEEFDFTAGANLSVDPSWPYRLTLEFKYTGPDGNPVAIGGAQHDNVKLLTVSGRLTGGPVEARFNALGWSPGTVAASGNGYTFDVDSPPDAAWFKDSPESRFRLQFNTVYRDPNSGDLALQAGIPVVLPEFRGEVANVCYRIEGTTFSAAGLQGGGMKVCLPAGAGVTNSATSRLLDSEIDLGPGPIPITPTGQPGFATWQLPASFLVHEQTPVRYAGAGLTWDVAAGTFIMRGANPIYLRKREHEWLEADAAAGALTNRDAARKPSNDAPWRRTLGTPTDVTISAQPGGFCHLFTSVELGGPPLTVALHHPAGVSLPLTGSSTISTANGLFSTVSTVPFPSTPLLLSGPVAVTYSRDGFEAGSCGVQPAGPATLALTAEGNALTMTVDGGWRAQGTLPAGTVVDWGGVHGARPTHRLKNVGGASLFVPGTMMSAYSPVEPASVAAALLLSGIGSPEDADRIERPHSEAYAQGLADYAGINIRVADGAPTASSFLAETPLDDYSLKPFSKYYVTSAGVSGVHDAVTATLPASIKLYGYDSRLDGLRLSYLDSENQKSATGGGITLPLPSGFDVAFNELTFRADGSLKDAVLPPNSPEVTLRYWQCSLKPDMLEFTPERADACLTGKSYLTLTGRVGLGTISDTPVRGALAFHPNGKLITPADNLMHGVDSSLPMPPGFSLKGRGTLKYPFAASTRLRFNNHAGANPVPAQGFLFTAGRLDVPFFEDLPVLLHLEPANSLAPAHVIGGWPSDPSQGQQGWIVNEKSYFNDTRFDSANRGYEGPLESFRGGLADHKYRPHVHKDWQRVLDLEFPVQWDALTREFRPAGNKELNLLVLKAEGQLKALDAAGAELAFGAKFVGLPNINTQSFARALSDVGSLAPGSLEKKLVNSMTSAFGNAISQPLLREGTAALDAVLDDTLDKLLDAPLRAALTSAGTPLDGALDELHAALKARYDQGGGLAAAVAGEAGKIDNARNALRGYLQGGLLAATDDASSMVSPLVARLKQADAALAQLEVLCSASQPAVDIPPVVNSALPLDALKTQPLLQAFARQALREFFASDFTNAGSANAQSAVRKLLKDLMEDARPVLRQVTATIGEAKRAIEDMRQSLEASEATARDLRGQLVAAFANADGFATSVLEEFKKQTAAARDASGRWFDEVSPDQFRRRFGDVLIAEFRKSEIEAKMKQALKRLLDPVRQTVHSAMNMVFGQVNNMVNQVALELVKNFKEELVGKAFEKLLGGASGAISKAEAGLGEFGSDYNKAKSVIQFAKAQGYARTRGDSLDELRVDASIGLAVPDEIGASVFVLIKNVQSDVPSTSCRPAGAVATEVTVGASGGVTIKQKKEGGPKPFRARLEGRFSFPSLNKATDFIPNGLDGLVDFESEMDLGALTLKQVQLRFGLGALDPPGPGQAESIGEAYATAAARGSIWFVEADANIFMGSTRQLSILRESLDPEVYDTVITRPGLPMVEADRCLKDPVIGLYGRAGGYLSVNRFFSIPDTCLLSLKAGRHMSEYVLLSGQGAGQWNAGIRDALDIKGTAICLGVSGQAGLLFNVEIDAAGIKRDGISSVLHNITGTARGWVEGCVDFWIGKACARADIIIGVKPNPALVPPLIFYPIAIEY